jgi:membrane fusion protein (multidrug efflux system)
VLWTQDSIARQDVDTQRQATQSAEATLKSAVAERRRLEALRKYEQVRAPFDGVITARNVEEGALISGTGAGLVGASTMPSDSLATSNSSGTSGSQPGSSTTSATGTSSSGVEMFHIAQIDRLRVYVNVPQESATLVKPGSPAAVVVQQSADAVYGAVVRTSHALDPSARTLLVEVQIPNVNNALLPGMFAHVRFIDPRPNAPLLVSGETLITRADGTSVAVLQPLGDAQRKQLGSSPAARCARTARLKLVTLGRDYGTQVEIAGGLRAGEFVVLNPGDMVRPGAILLPQLQEPKSDDSQGGTSNGKGQDKSNGKDDKSKKGKDDDGKRKDSSKDGDEAQDKRRDVEQNCLEQQAAAQAQAASAPAPAASVVAPGATTDKAPTAIGSPGMTAPTQGQGNKQK